MRLQLRRAFSHALLLLVVGWAGAARADVPVTPALPTFIATPEANVGPTAQAPTGVTGAPHATRAPGFTLTSVQVGLAAFVQNGLGWQSQAGRAGSPGSERLTVFEPQLVVVLQQSERLTHRLWVPLDFVTAASPNAMDKSRPPDMMSQASRQNESGTIAWDSTYAIDSRTTATFRNALHLEEDFRSWSSGFGAARSFAQDNTAVSLNATHTYDWFDHLRIDGIRMGRVNRATTNGSAGFTQVLTETTVVHANYGITVQTGELGNTWNAVPLREGGLVAEQLPSLRLRHALVGRFAQWLPWNGALKGFYRFYADDWGLTAHTMEWQLLQRLSPYLYVRGGYRHHTQTGVEFFTIGAANNDNHRTADSDLQRLHANSVSFGIQSSFPTATLGTMEIGATVERYIRSNDLDVDVAMITTGFRF